MVRGYMTFQAHLSPIDKHMIAMLEPRAIYLQFFRAALANVGHAGPIIIALPDVPYAEPAHPQPNRDVLMVHEAQTNGIIHCHNRLHCTLLNIENHMVNGPQKA